MKWERAGSGAEALRAAAPPGAGERWLASALTHG